MSWLTEDPELFEGGCIGVWRIEVFEGKERGLLRGWDCQRYSA